MWDALLLLEAGVGAPWENIILIVAVMAGIILVAKDFRLASMYWFVVSAGLFLWFYSLYDAGESVSYVPALVTCLISMAVMALNLFNVKRNEGVVV